MRRDSSSGRGFLTRPLVVAVLALFCCALWGSAFPGIKIGYRLLGIPSEDTGAEILFAGLRFTLAGGMVILAGSGLKRKWLLPRRSEWGMIFKLCLLQTALQYFFFYIGLAHSSGVKSAIITGCNNLLAILAASFLFRQETFTPPKALGCILGFAGVAAANLAGGTLDLDFHLTGEGFVFLAGVSYAFSSVMIKRYSVHADPVLLSGWQFLAGGLILSLAGRFMGGALGRFTVPAFGCLLYLGFLSAAAYTVWGILLKYNPVSRVTIYGFMNPVVGVLLSALLLGEGGQAFSMQNLAALALVSAGIYIVNRFQGETEENSGLKRV